MTLVAPTLQSFFTDRLLRQRHVSPRTVAAYRDSLRLLLTWVHDTKRIQPHRLDWADLDAGTITAFLDHLERERNNTARTRNLRLTAVRSLFSYASLSHPEHADLIRRVLAIPPKRFDRPEITFLTQTQLACLLDAPDRDRWEGRRDRALLALTAQAGLRVAELTSLNTGDITLGTAPTSAASAKAASTELSHSTPPPAPCSAAGSPNGVASETSRCSQPEPAEDSAPTPSSDSSASTPAPPQPGTRPSRPIASTHTCSGTPAP